MQVFVLVIGLILIGAALGRFLLYAARQAETAYPPRGNFVTVDGCRLHYVQQGEGQPVVLLHGSDGFLQDFLPVLNASDAQDVDFLAFDRPGHGYSDAPKQHGGALDTQARLLREAWRKLGVTRPVLVGHSWGAALALHCALEYPQEIAGLVLLSPWAYAASDPPPRLLYAARFFGASLSYAVLTLTPLKRWLVRDSLKTAFAPDPIPDDYERAARALWQRRPRFMRVFLEENADAWAQFPTLSARYPAIASPMLIVTGDCDGAVHAEQQAHRLHSDVALSELIVVPQTGHELPQTRPQLVCEAIARCLQKVAALPTAEPSPAIAANAALQRTRELVFRYGWNVTAYQLLNPDLEHWFTPDGAAVVGYVQRFHIRVAAGAPVCDESRLAEVVELFERDAAQEGERVCWFGASTRLKTALAELPNRASLAVGAQPVWNPAHWPEILKKNSSLRAQINRAGNKGVTVSEWQAERAMDDRALQRCLDEWLESHPFPTLHFLTEPVTLDRLTDRRLFVAEANGWPVGFLIATPVPSRNGWLVEQIVRGNSAPNGVSERLVDAAMRALAADGCDYVTLGLVPLTRRGWNQAVSGSLWLRVALAWMRAHGRRFYNFEGLDTFKAKFKPDSWEPIFALTNEKRVSLRALLAIAAAFSDGPLLWTLARALFAAASQETKWLQRRVTEKPS